MSRFSSILSLALALAAAAPLAAHADQKAKNATIDVDANVRSLDKDDCHKDDHFWYGPKGGSCHVCPVGKLLKHEGDCVCPEGFIDLGKKRSCACPAGMLVVFHPRAHCEPQEPEGYKTGDTKVNETDEAKDAPEGVEDDQRGVCIDKKSCEATDGQQNPQ